MKKKVQLFTSVAFGTVAVLIGLMVTWFRVSAHETIANSRQSEVSEIIKKMEFALEADVIEAENDLSLIAQYISDFDITDNSIGSFFQTQSQVEEFYKLYYVSLDGVGVSTTNELFDFSTNEAFLYALQGDYYITEPHISEFGTVIVLDIAVPIIKEGVVSAVLLSEYVKDDFFGNIKNTLHGIGNAYIISDDLSFIHAISDTTTGDLFNIEKEEVLLAYNSFEQSKKDLLNDRSGSFFYVHNEIDKILGYAPITMTDWALTVTIEAESLNSELVKSISMLEAICVTIYWFLIGLIFYSTYYHIRTQKTLKKIAYYDPLTELPNLQKLKRMMKKVLRKDTNSQYIIIVFDIENFKALNELYGYEIGDRVLRASKSFGLSLGEKSLVVARIHDDKFAMFAGNGLLDNLEDLARKRIKFYLKEIPETYDYHIQFNCGRYIIKKGETDVEKIISKVCLAHKTVKDTKGQLLCDYDDAFTLKVKKNAEILAKMRSALERKEYKVFLQPKFSVKENELIGAEALVRWIEDDGSMIFPNDFIPLFEGNGFIVKLDMYIFEAVCMKIRQWMDIGYNKLVISVNCSRQNLNNKNFVKNITAIADKYNVPHDYIEIELTESTAAEHEDIIENLFRDLHEAGFKISIDDFGSGYSSLGMLKNLKADTLKLDRSFFIENKEELRGNHVVERFIELAHDLDMYVVAEGIERVEQIEALKEMNCDAVQGYVHSKPISVGDFEEKYKDILR